MAALTIQAIKAPFATISANGADFTWTAGSVVSDTIAATGREIILAYNSDGANPYTLTITSVVDDKNRTGDITTYSLSAGEYAAFGCALTNALGWKSTSTGLITVSVSNAAVKWAVLQLPAGYPG